MNGADEYLNRLAQLEKNSHELRGDLQSRDRRAMVNATVFASVLAAVLATFISTIMPFLAVNKDQRRLEELLPRAAKITAGAEEKLAAMGGLDQLKKDLDAVRILLLQTEGPLKEARRSADEAKKNESESRRAAVKVDELSKQAALILDEAAELRDLIQTARDAAGAAQETVDLLRETTVVDFNRALEELTASLEIELGEWVSSNHGVLQRASSSGFVVAVAEASDVRDKKSKISRKSGEICGYSGVEADVKNRGRRRAAAYVNVEKARPVDSLVMPVREGDYWLVDHCSTVTRNQPEIDVSWLSVRLITPSPASSRREPPAE